MNLTKVLDESLDLEIKEETVKKFINTVQRIAIRNFFITTYSFRYSIALLTASIVLLCKLIIGRAPPHGRRPVPSPQRAKIAHWEPRVAGGTDNAQNRPSSYASRRSATWTSFAPVIRSETLLHVNFRGVILR